jgi:holo-[acyl-carrier-protein] synthase
MIIGHGIDLLEIKRVSAIYQKFNDTFVNKYFALDKIDKITPKILSNNFAIKEAFSKSLGLGLEHHAFQKTYLSKETKWVNLKFFQKMS